MRLIPNQRCARQKGFTLVELMIALVLGMLVIAAASVMVVSSRQTYTVQDEGSKIQDNIRFATELFTRLLRTSGYTNFGTQPGFPTGSDDGSQQILPPITGATGASIFGIDNVSGAPNNSDSLTLSFSGGEQVTGTGGLTSSVMDCLGNQVWVPDSDSLTPLPLSVHNPVQLNGRAVNTFYVALGASGGPELFCDTHGSGNVSLIAGVEDFQVLYGVNEYAHGTDPTTVYDVDETTHLPLHPPVRVVFKRADQMGAITWNPGALWATSASLATLNRTPRAVTDWDFVNDIRIGLVVRGEIGSFTGGPQVYNLFGDHHTDATDLGAILDTSTLAVPADRTRLRKVFTTTISIRNFNAPLPSNG